MTVETDIVIVGGGVAGLSLAAHLAGAAGVVLLEAEDALGFHASGRSAALFAPHYGAPTVKALSLASDAHYRDTDPAVLLDRGIMVVGRAEDAAAFEADCADLGLDRITLAEARARVPILNPETTAFAAQSERAWDVDTDLVLQGFARSARAQGAVLRTRAPVQGLARAGDGWEVTVPDGVLRARVVVNAAGAWADALARIAGVAPLGLRPLRRSMARLPAPGGHDVAGWPMVLGAGERWYAKPDAGALIVSPADTDPVEPHDAWADDMVLAEGLARYEEMVTEPVTRVTASWAGLRSFTRDRTLAIGFAPDAPGFFWLAGQGGYGFQTAPAAAQLAADLIAGRPPVLGTDLVAALDPARFTG